MLPEKVRIVALQAGSKSGGDDDAIGKESLTSCRRSLDIERSPRPSPDTAIHIVYVAQTSCPACVINGVDSLSRTSRTSTPHCPSPGTAPSPCLLTCSHTRQSTTCPLSHSPTTSRPQAASPSTRPRRSPLRSSRAAAPAARLPRHLPRLRFLLLPPRHLPPRLRSLLRWNRRTRSFARASASWRQRPRRYACDSHVPHMHAHAHAPPRAPTPMPTPSCARSTSSTRSNTQPWCFSTPDTSKIPSKRAARGCSVKRRWTPK